MNKLKELRLKRGYTQRELADKVGCTPKYIGFLENNERIPSLCIAKRIADIFETSIEDIFLTKKCTKCTSNK